MPCQPNFQSLVESLPNVSRCIQNKFLLCCLKEWILDGYPISDGAFLSSFLLEQSVIEQKLTTVTDVQMIF